MYKSGTDSTSSSVGNYSERQGPFDLRLLLLDTDKDLLIIDMKGQLLSGPQSDFGGKGCRGTRRPVSAFRVLRGFSCRIQRDERITDHVNTFLSAYRFQDSRHFHFHQVAEISDTQSVIRREARG